MSNAATNCALALSIIFTCGCMRVEASQGNINHKNVGDVKQSIRMILIPAGTFLMGKSGNGQEKDYLCRDELPQHEVYLSSYEIGKYEVTRGEYRQFIATTAIITSSIGQVPGGSGKRITRLAYQGIGILSKTGISSYLRRARNENPVLFKQRAIQ